MVRQVGDVIEPRPPWNRGGSERMSQMTLDPLLDDRPARARSSRHFS
jgi:hypothetical protein